MRRTAVAGLAAVLMITGGLTGASPAAAASVLYEAEQATIVNGTVDSNHAGFTGTGFVNTANAAGVAVEFAVGLASAGSRTLIFRYANGTSANRPGSVTVGGTPLTTLSFPPTGAWSTWRTQSVTTTLDAGSSAVRVTATGSAGLPNLDSLTVDDGRAGGPISDPIPEDPIQSGLGLTLTQFAQFPQSSPVPAPTDDRLRRHARINYLGQIPGSSRLFVPDLNGRLYTLPPGGGSPSVYLDVRAAVGADFFSGRGLGSGFGFVAFHPEFAANGRLYTVHSEAFGALTAQRPDWTEPGAVVHSVLTEWTTANPAAPTFSGTRRTLLRLGFATYIHAIQQIDFNPTATPGSADYGLLYVAVGDGGIGVDGSIPQTRTQPFGKILRIDPRGTDGINGRYGIPPTNPFVGQPGLGEIYALGMRDPHRFSWDPADGRVFVGHIGEHDIEGVYDLRAGDNFGWSEREGAFVFDRRERCNLYPLPADDAQLGYDYPVAAFDHNAAQLPCGADAGHAIVGGFVYRGSALPVLRGKYVFGDLVDGRVLYTNASEMVRGNRLAPLYQLRIFNSAGTLTSMPSLAGDSRVDMRLGIDRSGELYVMAKANGRVWKVTGTRGSPP
ncbi:MAG TPA: PQQ-dependent sugar dehydrogenase [Actinophytocola sp.]|uniref:PQQ-dependent sugar dehydrogenase n=1 Tax=Actinophytocola sp. TaxID=1872138 RepID=UPI002DDCF2C4|nr:PQQ-dependent sugar dehydrogenase [Actinophytocola sp.]HEV2783679.1 PQQ-dependent sugar dehydrogenase [Actinophytocola sp.]